MSKAERFIQNYTRNCSNECWDVEGNYHPWLSPDEARKAVEIAREEMIGKACEYLNGLVELLNDRGHGLKKERIIGGLKQAMKDET